MLGATRLALAPALGVLYLTLVTDAGPAGPTVVPEPPAVARTAVAPDSLTATVRYVRQGGIEVITGVQYVLRLTFIAVDSTTAITRQAQSVELQALQPGDLVTVQYQETDEGKVAQSIVVQAPQREGGGR